MAISGLIRAAGGVVCRPGPIGLVEIAVIHRPSQDDWTLPKGKLEAGETAEQAAVREVEEETGLRVRVLRPMGCTAYADRKGRDKIVCYWVMWAEGGRFTPNEEVDQLRWLTVEEALELLTYPADKALLASQELP
jgi:8-oxo-dGTP pyrophosphatase MutT (NUDIX family)